MVFNSLGSNYNFKIATKALFALGGKSDEIKLKDFLEEKYQGRTVLLYKGRQAILLALKLLGLPEKSLVAVNGFTCYAVYQAIVEAGCKAEYLDVDAAGLNFSAQSLKTKLKSGAQIKVVIIQNTLGYPCDIAAISEICRQNNIILIEDLAHSAGTVYPKGQEAGSVGDFVILSFSQDKIIDAVSGGALIIRNKKYQDISLARLSLVPRKQRLIDHFYPNFTFNIRMNYKIGLGRLAHMFYKKLGLLSKPIGALDKIVLQSLPGWYCRFALAGLKNLSANISRRRRVAEVYAKNLNQGTLMANTISHIKNSTNLRFPILVNNRPGLIGYLKNQNIHVSDIWYDAPVAPEKLLRLTDYKHQCPNAEKVSATMVNLPTHINISIELAEAIAKKINQWTTSVQK